MGFPKIDCIMPHAACWTRPENPEQMKHGDCYGLDFVFSPAFFPFRRLFEAKLTGQVSLKAGQGDWKWNDMSLVPILLQLCSSPFCFSIQL